MDYREKIIEIINKIERKDILRFIYIVISGECETFSVNNVLEGLLW